MIIGTDLDGVLTDVPENFLELKNPDKTFKLDVLRNQWYKNYLKYAPTKLKVKADIIITGRKEKYRAVTEEWLKANKVTYKKIYFFSGDKTRVNLIKYKAGIINEEHIDLFYEDDKEIAGHLSRLCPNTKIEVIPTTGKSRCS